jgi:hypothetical protein
VHRFIACLLLALVFAASASAARLDRRVVAALEPVAGPGIGVDCHLNRPEALGHAFRARRVIGVRPWICRRANAALAGEPPLYSDASYRTALAILILTHEAVHLSSYTGATDEALTECRAIQLVRDVALRLGATDEVARALGHEALHYDAQLPGYGDYRVGLGLIPNYHATGCYDGGALDIHPDSTDWPN